MTETIPTLNSFLTKLGELRGSDLHLKVGSPPAFRVAGELVVGDYPKMTAEATRLLAEELMDDGARKQLQANGDVDFAFGRSAVGRFRVNVYRQRGSVNVAVRAIGSGTFSFEELGLPHALDDICRAEDGLVVVTGGAGSGKTTTLAAMIDHINRSRRVSILTIEDPIEVLHSDKMGLVSQREVGVDTPGFVDGLHKSVRQDPDVVHVSEIKDLSTMEAAFHVARTGHLVLTSMHTADAEETMDRMISMYPPEDLAKVRRNMSAGVRAIVSLRLMNRLDEAGRIPAVEVLINTERVTDNLAGAKGALRLRDIIIDGAYFGMQSIDQSLLKLQQKGLISFQYALASAVDPTDFKLAVQAMGLRSA